MDGVSEDESDLEGLELVRAALVLGESSGEPEMFDFDSFIEQKRHGLQ